MKKFIEKIGMDKVAHLGVGGLLCAMVALVFIGQEHLQGFDMMLGGVLGMVVVFILSVMKEFMDETFDWGDVVYAMVGCGMVMAAMGVGGLFG